MVKMIVMNWFSVSLWVLCVIYGLVLESYGNVESSFVSDNSHCFKEMNSSCQCIPTANEKFIQCSVSAEPDPPFFTASLTEMNKGNAILKVTCPTNLTDTIGEAIYNFINGISPANVSAVKIMYCPLPIHGFASLFKLWKLDFPQLRKLIFRSSSELSTLPLEAFQQLSNITDLVLESNQLRSLPIDIFRNLKNLRVLQLTSNQLRIDQPLFENLKDLHLLQLGLNKIENLNETIFNNLEKMVQLNLENNLLETIPQNLFKKLRALKVLDLSNNRIVRIEQDLFSENQQLVELALRNNWISSLPSGLLKNNKLLLKLLLQGNRNLSSIPEDLFDENASLNELHVNDCNIESVNERTFLPLTNLSVLNLARNSLKTPERPVFSTLKSLRSLDLSGNRITSIPEYFFDGLISLETLQLNNNQLTLLEARSFAGLQSLQVLFISNNRLGEISIDSLLPLESLQKINLSNNRLSFHPLSPFFISPLRNNFKLKEIDLSGNMLEEIFDDWQNFFYLTHLNLSRNRIRKLSYRDLTFNPNNDLSIDLRQNDITEIDFSAASDMDKADGSSLSSVKKTVYIDTRSLVCDCKTFYLAQYMNRKLASVLHSWEITAPNMICSHPGFLYNNHPSAVNPAHFLCPCEIDTLPCSCWKRPVDRHFLIDCQQRNLTTFPSTIPTLVGYKATLNMSYNQLTTPYLANLASYPSVMSMDLSSCGLNSTLWDIDWSLLLNQTFPNLTELALKNNVLQVVPASILKTWTEFKLNVALGGNPWRCDCKDRPLLEFLTQFWGRIIDMRQITCPDGSVMSSLTPEAVCPVISTTLKSIAVAVPLLALMALGLFTIFRKYRRFVNAWLYNKGFCLTCIAKDEDVDDDDRPYDAFVSFSHKDEDFVLQHLVPQLEQPAEDKPSYRLCLHYRDWLAGEWIPEQIARSVASSKRTIVILTEHFLDSLWGKLEFRTAYQHTMEEKRPRLIVIVIGEVPSSEGMVEELKTFLSLNTYLKWGDPWFWERLRYALPHKKGMATSRVTQAILNHNDCDKEQHMGVKLNGLPPLPLNQNRENMHIILPPDIELSLTPTSSASSTAPIFPSTGNR